LALAHSRRDQRQELERLVTEYPALVDHEWFQDVAACVRESGDFGLY
jgi:hypothetical protein